MSAEFSLCRYRDEKGHPHLGLMQHGQLYDLTATGQPHFASLEAWLAAAGGRVEAAFDELEQVAGATAPVASAEEMPAGQDARLLRPLDAQEVWACGVTYELSREARMRESEEPTIYGRVYDAARPEIFFKATPHRTVGPGEAVAIRGDSAWNVPEPELALLVTPSLDIVGYTIGNDMSSRSIEGENPLYLPQAKVYDRCCALGPVVRLARGFNPLNLAVSLTIERGGKAVFQGGTHTSKIHRPLEELATYLGRCNSFPTGVFVVTGTGIVPPDNFTLAAGDVVEIAIEGLGVLRNPVIALPVS